MRKLISIVTPVYNEEATVEECACAVRQLFEGPLSSYEFEHVFSDNASTDRTVEILRQLAAKDSKIKVILNARNFGPFRSMFNALLATRGDAVVALLSADLQDPPEVIVDFVRLWESGHEIVYGIRQNREESTIMKSARKIYYRVVSRLAAINIPIDVGEFQLIDRKVVAALSRFRDQYPYLRGMIASCGFQRTGVSYTMRQRRRGVSKNSLYNLIDQALNGLISVSNIPLRLSMLVGLVLSMLSLVYAFSQLIINLIFWREFSAPGIATLTVAVFFFAGVQLFCIGILGEYIGAIHGQVRGGPMVIERGRINFDENTR